MSQLRDELVIGEFGPFQLEADYFYRVARRYENKHAPLSPEDIQVEKVEIRVKKHRSVFNRETKKRDVSWETMRTLTLLDIPGWLWALLTDHDTLECLDPGPLEPDPDRLHDEREDDKLDFSHEEDYSGE